MNSVSSWTESLEISQKIGDDAQSALCHKKTLLSFFFSAKENEVGVSIFVLNGGFHGFGELSKP